LLSHCHCVDSKGCSTISSSIAKTSWLILLLLLVSGTASVCVSSFLSSRSNAEIGSCTPQLLLLCRVSDIAADVCARS
jgi:hypothetical protein